MYRRSPIAVLIVSPTALNALMVHPAVLMICPQHLTSLNKLMVSPSAGQHPRYQQYKPQLYTDIPQSASIASCSNRINTPTQGYAV